MPQEWKQMSVGITTSGPATEMVRRAIADAKRDLEAEMTLEHLRTTEQRFRVEKLRKMREAASVDDL